MGRVIFLLEEPSMAAALRGILPKIYPNWVENVDWIAIPHGGKSDLENSIRRKVRAWNEPGVRFVILRDNDCGDCIARKARLRDLASDRDASEVLIRIVCQELESWFLGDLAAINAVYNRTGISPDNIPAKFRDPDKLANAAKELAQLTGTNAKVSRAESIAQEMNLSANRSKSFQVFVSGLQRLVRV